MLNDRVVEVTLAMQSPPNIHFLAGQFVSVQVTEKSFRSYSIASNSSQTNTLQIIVSIAHDGIGSTFLRNLKIGDHVTCIGPSGRFVLPERPAHELVFIVTGTGIAPILSMLDELKTQKCQSSMHLLFGIRDMTELFAIDRLEEFQNSLPQFDYTICFSQTVPEHIAHAVEGRVTDHIHYSPEAEYFLCGHPFMVRDASDLLIKNGVPETQIFHEKFTVAQPQQS